MTIGRGAGVLRDLMRGGGATAEMGSLTYFAVIGVARTGARSVVTTATVICAALQRIRR